MPKPVQHSESKVTDSDLRKNFSELKNTFGLEVLQGFGYGGARDHALVEPFSDGSIHSETSILIQRPYNQFKDPKSGKTRDAYHFFKASNALQVAEFCFSKNIHALEYVREGLLCNAWFDVEFNGSSDMNVEPTLRAVWDCIQEFLGSIVQYNESILDNVISVAWAKSKWRKTDNVKFPDGKHSYHIICNLWRPLDGPSFLHGYLPKLIELCEKNPLLHYMIDGALETVIDPAVYGSSQPMRMLGQTKFGTSNKLETYYPSFVDTSRFVISESAVDYLCGSYGRCGHKDEPFKTVVVPRSIFDTTRSSSGMHVAKTASLNFESDAASPMFDALVDLCKRMPKTHFSSNGNRFSFVQACRNVENTERCFDLVMQTLPSEGSFMRDRDYVYTEYWRRSKAYNWNIKSISKIVKQASKDSYDEHYKLFAHLYQQQTVQQITEPPVESVENHRLHHIKIESPKLPVIELFSSMIIKSQMGTGKTTALRNLMASQRFERVLYISCRRTFTMATIRDLAKLGLDFINYMNSETHELDQNYLFVQMESLFRMKPNQTYDLVVLDESETLASIMSPIATHGNNYLKNMSIFKDLIKSSTHVYAMDAFVGPRTMELMQALRSGTIEYLENTFQPFNRKAYQLLVEKKDKKTGATIPGSQDNDATFQMFVKHILNALHASQKTVVVWSSRTKALEFEKFLKQEFPKFQVGTDYLFYESKDNKKIRKDTLANVQQSWASVQLLMYTSAISVGVNYDVPEMAFDKLFVYAGAGGPCVRDMFQSTLRCRTIKSNTMEYMINDTCRRFGKAESLKDLEDDERYWKVRNEKFMDRCHQFNEDANIMHGVQLAELETWHNKIILLNRFERALCSNLWETMFNEYLSLCGYTRAVYINPNEDIKLPKLSKESQVLYEDVRRIDEDQANEIERSIKREESISTDEYRQLDKFYFKRKFRHVERLDSQAIEYMWTLWQDVHGGRPMLCNVFEHVRRDTIRLVKDTQDRFEGFTELYGKSLVQDAHIRDMISKLGISIGSDSDVSEQNVQDTITWFKEHEEAILRDFGIRDQTAKTGSKKEKSETSTYMQRISNLLKSRFGCKLSIESKRVRVKGTQDRVYQQTVSFKSEKCKYFVAAMIRDSEVPAWIEDA